MLWIAIDRSLPTSLTQQVYEQLRTKILKRELQAGDKLPPTRTFAQELQVSRNIMINAYEQLIAEGYLESREGSGTYVAKGTYLEAYKDYYSYELPGSEPSPPAQQNEGMINFASGTPDLRVFPRKIWAKLLREVCLDAPECYFNYGEPGGIFELRRALSRFLLRTKGIRCHPEQMIVLSGSSQGFFVIAKLLAASSAEVILEDPSYNGIQRILESLDIAMIPVPVDEKGIRIDMIPEKTAAGFVIVTPSHQFPLGSVLPIQRRVKLIEYARKTNTYIVENDYDSEFRYTGPPISSLHLLEPERVIHVATLSESLYPSIRLGYMIVPPTLIHQCRGIIQSLGLTPSSMPQIAMAQFIEDGHLERHVNRMKKVYRKKREVMTRALQQAFGEQVKVSGDSTGLYVVAEFHDVLFSQEVLDDIYYEGVLVYPVEDHALRKGQHCHKIIIGYGNVAKEKIGDGIEGLRKALQRHASRVT